MERRCPQMHSIYQQLGMDFTDEKNQMRKNRSQNFSFGLICQNCIREPEAVALHVGIYTPYGSKEFSERYSLGSTNEDYLHQHDYYELMYVRSGIVNASIETERRTYQPGDALLVNRFARHLELYDHSGQVLYLCISKNFTQGLLNDLKNHNIPKELINFLYQNNEREDIYARDFLEFKRSAKQADVRADDLLCQIRDEMAALKPGYIYIVQALLLRFFHLLSDQTIYSLCIGNKEGSAQDHIFEAVREYIVDNNGIVSRKQMEQELHFHGDYLNRIVKARTGMSLLHFAQSYRMKETARLLSSTEQSVTSISQLLGFSNKTHFYRLFQKTYHMTPIEYRRFCNTRK